MKKYAVYKHENLMNGKVYIGITGISVEDRWKNGLGYYLQPKFYNAIKKYGWNNFRHEILYTGLDKITACKMEKILIKSHDSIRNGYNVSDGGGSMVCSPKLAVKKYNAYTGELICTYPSIYEASQDVGIQDSHISEACQGKLDIVGGYCWSYINGEYRKPKRISHFGYMIARVDLKTNQIDRIYKTLKDAADDNGVSKSTVSMCCNKRQKQSNGYTFEYVMR